MEIRAEQFFRFYAVEPRKLLKLEGLSNKKRVGLLTGAIALAVFSFFLFPLFCQAFFYKKSFEIGKVPKNNVHTAALEVLKEKGAEEKAKDPVEAKQGSTYSLKRYHFLNELSKPWEAIEKSPANFVHIEGIDRPTPKKFLLKAKEISKQIPIDDLFSSHPLTDSEKGVLILSGFEKCVLIELSPYFRGIFSNFKESFQGIISIESTTVLKTFIDIFEKPSLSFEALSLEPTFQESLEDLFNLCVYANSWGLDPILNQLEDFMLEQLSDTFAKINQDPYSIETVERLEKLCTQANCPLSLKKKYIKAMGNYLGGDLVFTWEEIGNLAELSFGFTISFNPKEFAEIQWNFLEKLGVVKLRLYNFRGKRIPLHVPMLRAFRMDGVSPELTDEGLQFLQNCPNLEELDLDASKIDKGLKHIRGEKLQKISLSSLVKLTDEGLQFLQNCPNLEEFSLISCPKVVDGLKHIRGEKLRKLNLYDCVELSGEALQFLQNCPNLEELLFDTCEKGVFSGLKHIRGKKLQIVVI